MTSPLVEGVVPLWVGIGGGDPEVGVTLSLTSLTPSVPDTLSVGHLFSRGQVHTLKQNMLNKQVYLTSYMCIQFIYMYITEQVC